MSNFSFTEDAFAEYIYWQTQDRKTLKKINALLNDINRHPFEGLGKPEPLKGNYKGFWSRRIDDANRIIYRVTDDYSKSLSAKATTTTNNNLTQANIPSLGSSINLPKLGISLQCHNDSLSSSGKTTRPPAKNPPKIHQHSTKNFPPFIVR